MNRKLHNTILAFSVTGVMLFVGLVIAEPAHSLVDEATPAALQEAGIGTDNLPASPTAGLTGHDEARKAFEADIARAANTGEAIAIAAGYIAVTATETALAAAMEDLERRREERKAIADADTERKEPATRRKASATRELIAVPYFSFARGSRGSRS